MTLSPASRVFSASPGAVMAPVSGKAFSMGHGGADRDKTVSDACTAALGIVSLGGSGLGVGLGAMVLKRPMARSIGAMDTGSGRHPFNKVWICVNASRISRLVSALNVPP